MIAIEMWNNLSDVFFRNMSLESDKHRISHLINNFIDNDDRRQPVSIKYIKFILCTNIIDCIISFLLKQFTFELNWIELICKMIRYCSSVDECWRDWKWGNNINNLDSNTDVDLLLIERAYNGNTTWILYYMGESRNQFGW